jgi:hypothetical protein
MVFLSYLVALWKICVKVMLSVKFDTIWNLTLKSKRRHYSNIQALRVKNWQHSRHRKIKTVGMGIGLTQLRRQRA